MLVGTQTVAYFRTCQINSSEHFSSKLHSVFKNQRSSSSSKVNSYIRTPAGIIESKESLKILGFTFSNEPNANAHVKILIEKMYRKLWSLRFLKRSGMRKEKLLVVYKSIIRPTADYCAVVYNSLIPEYLSEQLGRVQRHALRIIFGSNVDVDSKMEENQVEKLADRRYKKSVDFANKAVRSDRFGTKWFNKNQNERTVRNTTRKTYVEKFCKHESMRNNPLNVLTRILNDNSP